ncbi:Protein SSH4 [Cryoendolithus antarcticus]|uniref:Protein SSH4 n=1 Tax=Cryoendolithus antarcticus TaxID=1507870 RepID=A0A1V8SFA3_9PEZI|nr:Protein SSH4 [Cryoendolithus antarcticus]
MAQPVLYRTPATFATSYIPSTSSIAVTDCFPTPHTRWQSWQAQRASFATEGLGSTGKGILIGILSAFGSAAFIGLIIAAVYFFRYTNRGRILLDRFGRPGEYDDEQAFLREEEDALAAMDEGRRGEYARAKAFVTANPPDSLPTDISLSQFLAIQEKGVSAWEFDPAPEIAPCFISSRTEIDFFDTPCSVQSNLPIPKQNETYYFEAKIYDKPSTTLIAIGLTTKPYPLFRLPGYHKHSIAYTSSGSRRFNQPFTPFPYGPPFVQGDVVGVGYRPRTGSIFFTRNGKKLDDLAHGLKTQNFFPTVGADGPASVHVNFGQAGFVFIEANVKKWGLAPMTGSLAPPPPYGSEQGSILLEGGRAEGWVPGHGRSQSAQQRLSRGPTTRSPGPERSPTEISLAPIGFNEERAQEAHEEQRQDSDPEDDDEDEEFEPYTDSPTPSNPRGLGLHYSDADIRANPGLPLEPADRSPPPYPDSPSPVDRQTPVDGDERDGYTDGSDGDEGDDEGAYEGRTALSNHGQGDRRRLLSGDESARGGPPIPSYEEVAGERRAGRR